MNQFLLILLILSLLIASTGCDEDNDTSSDADTTQAPDVAVDVAYAATHLKRVQSLQTLPLTDVQRIFNLLQLQVPAAAEMAAGLVNDVSVYRLTYQTTYNNTPVHASALLAVPQSITPMPVIAFQNGTNTVKANAPTENHTDIVIQMVSASASLGYVIAVADYPGFGESAQLVHPYLCREATVISLLDMLYAVVELAEDVADSVPVALSGDLYLLGYSQGAHATMALHEQLERTPDFPLVLQATAAGAGPYNMTTLNTYMFAQSAYPMPYYGPYTVMAFQSLGFIPNDLALYFNAPYATAIPTLFDGTKDADEINAALTTDLSRLYAPAIQATADGQTTTDDAAAQALLTAFETNSIPPFASTVPIRFSHGTSDVYIAPAATLAFQQAIIAAGTPEANISVLEIPDKDHETAAPFAVVDAISWFNEMQKK